MPATIIICLLLAAVVALILRKLHTDRKRGNTCSSCGGGCSGCSGAGLCHPDGQE